MIPGDPNVRRIEAVAEALGNLRDRLVLVGGCAVGLLLDNPAATPPRVTYDVDLVAEIAALRGYHALEKELADRGFAHDRSPDAPICRWVMGAIKVDLMPSNEGILGFGNRWYPEAIRSSVDCRLPSGAMIRLISAPAFIGTKFEAFDTRGAGDMVASHDFEDLLAVIEGRSTVVAEIASASSTLRAHLVSRLSALANDSAFQYALPGLIAQDALREQRVAEVRSRLAAIARL